MKGYGGRILFVDATSGASRGEPVSEELARRLLGGDGFAARLLLGHGPAGADSLDPAHAGNFPGRPRTDPTVAGNRRALHAARRTTQDACRFFPRSSRRVRRLATGALAR